MESSKAGFESEPTKNNQFRELVDCLTPVMNWNPDYYTIGKIADILKSLDIAKTKLKNGDLAPPNLPLMISIYEGGNEDLMMELYAFLSQMTHTSSAGYPDLVAEINELYKNNLRFEEGSPYKELISHEMSIGDKTALTVSGAPSGIAIKIADNIYSVFRSGNINNPEPGLPKELMVDILVADIES